MLALADNLHSTLSLVGTMCKDIHSNMYTKAVVSLCPCQQFLHSLKFSLILVKSLQFVALFSSFTPFLSAGLTLSVLSLYGFVFYVSVHFHITVFLLYFGTFFCFKSNVSILFRESSKLFGWYVREWGFKLLHSWGSGMDTVRGDAQCVWS